MSIKVGHTSVTAVPGVDAKQHTSPGHQKMSTAQQPTQTQESPAYTVDLSVRERLENMDPADRIRWILSNFKRFDGTVTTGMDKEFEEKYRARQKEVTEKAQKDFNDMFEQIDPAEVFSGPGYQAPRTRTDPAAVAALILGLLFFIPGTGAIAAILGLWALRRLRGSYDAGLTQAWFGVVVGGAATIAWLWIWCLITLPG